LTPTKMLEDLLHREEKLFLVAWQNTAGYMEYLPLLGRSVGHTVVWLVEALCYKLKGHRFES
jgi:hypothetical protein